MAEIKKINVLVHLDEIEKGLLIDIDSIYQSHAHKTSTVTYNDIAFLIH